MTIPDGLRRLRPYFDEVCVRAGEQVAAEGRLCHQFFIVVEGELRSCRGGQTGRLGPGDEFGWEAMRERGVNEATVYALTDSRLLVMGHAQFRAADALALSSEAPAATPRRHFWAFQGPPLLPPVPPPPATPGTSVGRKKSGTNPAC